MQKNFNIRKMQKEDREDILQMMKIFYSSDAVFTNGSDEIFKNDFENCINESLREVLPLQLQMFS